jgi:hypothetical protein
MQLIDKMSSEDKVHGEQDFVEKFQCPRGKSSALVHARLGEPSFRQMEKVSAEAHAIFAQRQREHRSF